MNTPKRSRLAPFITGLFFVALITGCASTPEPEPVTDIDGNEYKTVRIGNQVWMAENLKTTRYNDGSEIPNIEYNKQHERLTTGAYYWYDNNPNNGEIFGALYNWYAVATNKLCPHGWRVPTDADWTKLTDYLGGRGIAGAKLKATGTLEAGDGLWHYPNEGATNETGFWALPGGFHSARSRFYDIGQLGVWWSSSEYSTTNAWNRSITKNDGYVRRGSYFMRNSFSIRCIREDDN